MVRQTTVAGPVSRAMGVRIHTEMGDAGEDIWTHITGGTRLGRSRLAWRGGKPPPVDVIDFGLRIGYQVKVKTDPTARVAYSGAHRNVRGSRVGGRPRYVGTPEDKLEDIREYLQKNDLNGVLIVMTLDEDANRAVVYGYHGVDNVTIKDMEPLGVINNDTNTFEIPKQLQGGFARLGIPEPVSTTGLPPLPNIPVFLRSSTSGEVVPEIEGVQPLFRRPVAVRAHRRRR